MSSTNARKETEMSDPKRGIPPVSDYAHWNEEAEAVWWAENRYDMMYQGEHESEDWYDEE